MATATHTMTDNEDLASLLTAFHQATAEVDRLVEQLSGQTEGTGEHEATKTELAAAEENAKNARTKMFAEWENGKQKEASCKVADHAVTDDQLIETKQDRDTVHDQTVKSSTTSLTARIVPPKEYKYGENFTTWCSRFRRYLKIGNITNNNLCEILLNNVDDRTLEKLEPVAENLKRSERRDPDLFIPIFEQAMYPKSEIRAWRQQLTNGQLVQQTDEDVDSFASKIRSLAKKAYSDPGERKEPCLNAFLNGMRDLTLYDKVVAVPGAEEDFELAVDSARKFEKMRRTRTDSTVHGSTSEPLSVFRVEDVAESREERSSTQEYNRTWNDSYDRSRAQGHRSDRGGHQNRRQATHDSHNNRGRDSPQSRYNTYNNRRRDSQRRETRTCYRCNVMGHIALNCPTNPLNSNRAGSSSHPAGPQQ